jgi:uncharacterized protein
MKKIVLSLVSILAFSGLLKAQEITNGFVKFYYPNGQVSSEGTMNNGKPDGYWKTYYVTGVIKSEGLRTNFELDSTWTFYNQSGEVVQRIDYKYGKKNGYSFLYNYNNSPEGIIVEKELFVNDRKEGKAYYYFDDGKLKEEVPYEQGKKEGIGREFDKDGNVISLLEYHNNYLVNRELINRKDSRGLKQGTWKEFYPDGRLYKEMQYSDNALDDIYKEYAPNGSLSMVLKYEKGLITEDRKENILPEELDIRRSFNENGKVIFVGSYRNDIPVGIHRFYDDQGNVINSIVFDDFGNKSSEGIVTETGSREGAWKDFYSTGELRATGNYLNNRRSGRWSFYYKNGAKEQEGSYLRGLADGQWTWYYENAAIWREEGYFNGLEDGPSTEYDLNGKIITQGNYINGEKEGSWFYDVGDHKEQGNYQTGLRSGVWKYYYPGDILQFEGSFVSGQPNGKHKYFYENGNLREERYYEMGIREKNWKKYDENGTLTMAINYRSDVEYRINGEKVNLPKGSITVIK